MVLLHYKTNDTMVQIILTHKDLKFDSRNKPVTKIKLKDFNTLTFSQLGQAHSIIFIDEITKVTHNLR
jgi:hypothetical protein